MSLKEESEFGTPVQGKEHVDTLVQLAVDGALDPEDIGDPEVRKQVVAALSRL